MIFVPVSLLRQIQGRVVYYSRLTFTFFFLNYSWLNFKKNESATEMHKDLIIAAQNAVTIFQLNQGKLG